MEIINKKQPAKCDPYFGRNMFTGSVLVLAGVSWLLYNTGVLGPAFFDVVFSWQMLLIVIGGYLLCTRNHIAGGLLAGFGVLFLAADLLDVAISFHKVILPMLLIIAGLAIILRRR
ncbi:MAG: DUF5668 domain-containing protein [Rikenellaceae bacterium]|jgi:hypothetical protein|nr:DUF5668 domain-containing protein [Rikenellaceae bacterium]